jgi:hypothetical protein
LLQTFPPDYFFFLQRGKFPAAQMILKRIKRN